jgi:dipeptidyl aminopeptidase/acylaminoacyl peptidase
VYGTTNWNYQIYKVLSGGGAEIALTSDTFVDHYYPQWSPDGNWIVCQKIDTVSWNYQIHKVLSSGGAEMVLTSGIYNHEYPQWSPDGNWIVYEKEDASGYHQIYKVPSGGGTEIALVTSNNEYGLLRPQWSPDGNWILYQKIDSKGFYQIFKILSGGGAEIALTSHWSGHLNPQWSPDGNWIVYQKSDTTGHSQIYKVPSGVGVEEESNDQLSTGNWQLSILPNPFIHSTIIEYHVPVKANISLEIWDITGRKVKTLVDQRKEPGYYSATLDAKDLSTGIYFVRLIAGDYTETKRLILMR